MDEEILLKDLMNRVNDLQELINTQIALNIRIYQHLGILNDVLFGEDKNDPKLSEVVKLEDKNDAKLNDLIKYQVKKYMTEAKLEELNNRIYSLATESQLQNRFQQCCLDSEKLFADNSCIMEVFK